MGDAAPGSGPPRRIVVIGASAGGVSALRKLVGGLPPELPAAVLVVLHIGAHPSLLPELLASAGELPAAHAQDGDELAAARIYVAPPDHHLLLDHGVLRLFRGPKEHHSRPAVDPLFRSAALAHGPEVIGIVLTGHLDDGTAGLQAIKSCGGVAMVQDPRDAHEPSMPMSALRHVEVDFCLPIEDIAPTLTRLVMEPISSLPAAAPPALLHEHSLSLPTPAGEAMDHLKQFAEPSSLVCPDCGGALWEVSSSRPTRFRCHTGHAFTLRTLAHSMSEASELALQTAVRAMQEQALLLRKAARSHLEAGQADEAAHLEAGARRAESQTLKLRSMLESPPLQTLEPDLPTSG